MLLDASTLSSIYNGEKMVGKKKLEKNGGKKWLGKNGGKKWWKKCW